MEAIGNIGIGLLMIIFGIGVIIFMSKRPPSYPLTSVNFKGYAGGVAFIIIGIIYILNKLHLW
jgi:hypothetical protein